MDDVEILPPPSEPTERLARDRTLPAWMRVITAGLTAGGALSWMALALFPLLYLDLAVAERAGYAVGPITLGAAGAVACALIFEIARNQALRGFPGRWEGIADATLAGVWLLVVAVLGFIHPLLLAGPLAGAGVMLLLMAAYRGWLGRRVRARIDAAQALAILSGRERAEDVIPPPFDRDGYYAVGVRFAVALAFVTALATGAWLTVREVLTTGGYVSATLLAAAAAGGIACALVALDRRREGRRIAQAVNPRVESDAEHELALAPTRPEPELVTTGLFVNRLTVTDTDSGRALLGDVSFDVRPGELVAVVGPPGAGKSLLLKALANPHALRHAVVRGAALLDGRDMWARDGHPSRVGYVHVGEEAVMLDASVADNVCAFLDPDAPIRAERVLERLNLFGISAERILRAPDPYRLSATERRLVALARALHVGPGLYLLDRPELMLDARTIGALATALKAERHRGRSALIATDCRPLIEICDRVVVLDSGSVIEFDQRSRIDARKEAGWVRFEVAVDGETEDRLHNWLSAQFNRKGDETNRRNVCLVGSDLLALADPRKGAEGEAPRLAFEFRHAVGECTLVMHDDGAPIAATRLAEARKAAAESRSESAHTPLANLLRRCIDITQDHAEAGSGWRRRLAVRIETYDPRKSMPGKAAAAPAEGAPDAPR